jgi:hypothetical protein
VGEVDVAVICISNDGFAVIGALCIYLLPDRSRPHVCGHAILHGTFLLQAMPRILDVMREKGYTFEIPSF